MDTSNNIPGHWEVRIFEEACKKVPLSGIKIKQANYLSRGRYPVIDQGQDLIGGYYDDEKFLVTAEPPYIIFGDHTKVKKYVPFKFIAGADGVKVLKPLPIYNPKFFFYLIHTIHIPDKGYARHFQFLEKKAIPLPPLSEQQKIVAKIEELFSELDKSKQQLDTAQQQLKVYRQAVLKWAFEGKLTAVWREKIKLELRRLEPLSENIKSTVTDEAPRIANLKFRSQLHGTEFKVPGEAELGRVRNPSASPKNRSRVADPSSPQEENGLPEGWKVVSLSDYSQISGGLTKNPLRQTLKMQVPFLRVANVYFNFLDLTEIHTIGLKENEFARVKLEKNDLLFVEGNGSIDQIGRVALWDGSIPNCVHQNHLIKARFSKHLSAKYVLYYFCSTKGRSDIKEQAQSTSGLHTLSLGKVSKLKLPLCSIEEQQQIVQEIESRLSVCDKIEETLTASLQQAEMLRQSILKKAFEGKLVKAEKQPVVKPAIDYFLQVQILALIAKASRQKNIQHGEMTIAKYAYLADKIYDIPTQYNFERWHLGPYPPEIKKAIKNNKFFTINSGAIDLVDEKALLKYNNPYQQKIETAVNELTSIFSKYPSEERPHKTELLATICKVIEDIKSASLGKVRQSMNEWKIDLKNSAYKNKAEKFTEAETKKCLDFIIEKGWDKKLIGQQ